MGCFDQVAFNCPTCGAAIREQSKAGDRDMETFPAFRVPLRIAADIEGEKVECDNCGKTFVVTNVLGLTTLAMRLEEEVKRDELYSDS